MIDPQKEHGYTAIANEIMDALVAYRLPGEQMQCLLFILRKTYGYNKKADQISISQFQVATGLKKPSVSRALNGLLKKRIIKKKASKRAATYWFNKHYDQWEGQVKRQTHTPVSSLVHRCYLCGYSDVIDRHHIIHQADGGSDRVENIIFLCPNCHAKAHRGLLPDTDLLTQKRRVEEDYKESLTKKLIDNNEQATIESYEHSHIVNKKVNAVRMVKKPLTKKLIDNNEQATIESYEHSHIVNKKVNAVRMVKKPLTKKLHTKDNIQKTIYTLPQNHREPHLDGEGERDFYLTKKKRKLSGKRLESFEKFWTAFNYKKDKASAADAWMEIPALTNSLVVVICKAAEATASARPELIAKGRTPIYAQGWLSARRWEDEPPTPINGNATSKPVKKLTPEEQIAEFLS